MLCTEDGEAAGEDDGNTRKQQAAAREMDVMHEACALVPEDKWPPATQAPCMMPMPEWVAKWREKAADQNAASPLEPVRFIVCYVLLRT